MGRRRGTRWEIAGPGKMAAMVADFGRSAMVRWSRSDPGRRARAEFRRRTRLPKARVVCRAPARPGGRRNLSRRHPQHTDVAPSAIRAGKAILVEKAFTATVSDTRRIVDAARGAGVLRWRRCGRASTRHRAECVNSSTRCHRPGARVQGDLTAFRTFDPEDRFSHPRTGAVQCSTSAAYVLSFAQYFLGTPTSYAHGVVPVGRRGRVQRSSAATTDGPTLAAGAFTATGRVG